MSGPAPGDKLAKAATSDADQDANAQDKAQNLKGTGSGCEECAKKAAAKNAPPVAFGFVAPLSAAEAAAARQAAQEALLAANRAIAVAETEVAAEEAIEAADVAMDWNPAGWIIAGVVGAALAYALYKLYEAQKAKAAAEEKLKQIELQETQGQKDEICEAACQCKEDRGDSRTLTDCVAKKLRNKYYDKNGPKRPDGSPRYPKTTTADGPRPEVSYDPDNKYQPAPSKNRDGMPSSQVPITGMPRPDISWWTGGKLSKIYELKFGNDKDTPMQRSGEYQKIARSNGLDPKKDLIRINVDEDCECSPGGGKAK